MYHSGGMLTIGRLHEDGGGGGGVWGDGSHEKSLHAYVPLNFIVLKALKLL